MHAKGLRGCLVHPGLQPPQLNVGLSVTPGRDVQGFPLAEGRAGLFDHVPGTVYEACQEIEVLARLQYPTGPWRVADSPSAWSRSGSLSERASQRSTTGNWTSFSH